MYLIFIHLQLIIIAGEFKLPQLCYRDLKGLICLYIQKYVTKTILQFNHNIVLIPMY